MQKSKVGKIAGIGILVAVEIILSWVSQYLAIGPAVINLALVPICVAACLYGIWGGVIVGVVNGIFNIIGAAAFLNVSVFGTIIVCILKTGVAGLVSALLFKVISKAKFKGSDLVAAIVASLIVPIVNTGIFMVGVICFFMPIYEAGAAEAGIGAYKFLVVATITVNFAIEVGIAAVLSPAVFKVISIIDVNGKKKKAIKEESKPE